MKHLKDRACEWIDWALRELTPVPDKEDLLRDVEAANIRDYLRMTGALWSTPEQITRGTFLKEFEVNKTLYRLKRNDEVVVVRSEANKGSIYTTSERFHNELPLGARLRHAIGERFAVHNQVKPS